jgi:magnesium chelatase subunit D
LRGEADPGDGRLPQDGGPSPWADAMLAAALLAVDPTLGGAVLRARAGPARDAWLAAHLALAGRPARRLPPSVDADRLDGGIDLAATLARGRPVRLAGILETAAGSVLVLPMAERCPPGLAARLAHRLDETADAPPTIVALDEGAEPDEAVPEALAERLAFALRLDHATRADLARPAPVPEATIRAARARLDRTAVPDAVAERLVAVAAVLGIASLRAPLLALRAARAAAALEGEPAAGPRAEAVAARLVLGPRATRMPEAPDDGPEDAPDDPPPPPETADTPADPPEDDDAEDRPDHDRIPEEVLLEAARAAIPPDLLARLLAGAARERGSRAQGAGSDETSLARGRPAGTVPGRPRDGARVALVETLRAAAPWQQLRRAEAGASGAGASGARAPGAGMAGGRVLVRAGDIRLKRSTRRDERVAILVVDASGSTALARLAETKGAIEILLGQAYAGRESVALVAFRGSGAETLLPPTRSLVAAKRRLAGLPGGGATPLAAGLAEGLALAARARAKGAVPTLAILTDGRANVARDGTTGRPQAEADALDTARAVRAAGVAALVIDTGNRPSAPARALADAMGADYLPLPRADASKLAAAVRAASADTR